MRTTSKHPGAVGIAETSPLPRTPRVRDAQPFDPSMSLWHITTLSVAMVYASLEERGAPGAAR